MTTEKEIISVIKSVRKASADFRNTALMEVASIPRNAFQVLVSCIISLRTRDEVTAAASRRLFSAAPDPYSLMKLPVNRIERLIYPAGFYKTKARRLKEIARIIHEDFNDAVPETLEELVKLKGVGRKTANIVLVYGHGKRYHIPVDTHVHRIPNRLGWISTKKPEQTEAELMKIIPRRYWRDFNDLFVQFGQNICRPVGPKCHVCPISDSCRHGKRHIKEQCNI